MGNYLNQLGQQLGTGIANNVVGTGMGLLLEGHNDRRQRRQQQAMNDIENARAKEMVDYNMARQLEMWKATSYGAQKEQMIKAGLNPALMYGMSGGGGQSIGNTQGGTQGAEAPKGGGEIINAMGIQMQSAQLSLLQAQKANIEADTANKAADTSNKPIQGKNIQASTESIIQGVENQKAQKELLEVQTDIARIEQDVKGRSSNMMVAMLEKELQEKLEQVNQIARENSIGDAIKLDIIKTVHSEMLQVAFKNELIKAQTKNTKESTWAIRRNVENQAYQIAQKITNETWSTEQGAQNASTQRDRLANEIANETGIPSQIIDNIIDALILKKLMVPGQPARNPIGYK